MESIDVLISMAPDQRDTNSRRRRSRIEQFGQLCSELTTMGFTTSVTAPTPEQASVLSELGIHNVPLKREDSLDGPEDADTFQRTVSGIERRYKVSARKLVMAEMVQKNWGSSATWKDEDRYVRRLVAAFEAYERIFANYQVGAFVMGPSPFVEDRAAYLTAKKTGIPIFILRDSPFNDRPTLVVREEEAPGREIVGLPETADPYTKELVRTIVAQGIQMKAVPAYLGPMDASPLKLSRMKARGFYAALREGFNDDLGRVGHLVATAKKIVRAMRARQTYQPFVPSNKFFVFAMHDPSDAEVLSRGEPFTSQEYLIEHVARNLPYGYSLFVKPHPGSEGLYSVASLRKIAKMPSVRLLRPDLNPHDAIMGAAGVITISSSIGWEAIAHSKPVIAFGRPLYEAGCQVVSNVNMFATAEVLNWAVDQSDKQEDDIEFLTQVYQASHKGHFPPLKEYTDDGKLTARTIAATVEVQRHLDHPKPQNGEATA